jgi:hypothetical protein
MRFRKLRIAWSVACGIVCALLIVMWVRSQWITDSLEGTLPGNTYIQLASIPGAGGIVIYQQTSASSPQPWIRWSMPSAKFWDGGSGVPRPYSSGLLGYFDWKNQSDFMVVVPDWFLIVVTISGSTLPWLPFSKRFTLRTLLIATTLIALVLGAIVWTVR